MSISFSTALTPDYSWGNVLLVPDVAEKLERWGYDCIWCPDERFGRNVYSVLSLAATSTTNIKLGVSVTNPYTRHPLITAAAIYTGDDTTVSGLRTMRLAIEGTGKKPTPTMVKKVKTRSSSAN